ncbi:NAD-dependent epimerase/dehydratase family protein [Rhodobacterales bacterium HKCCE2091]|nr:NAD-dependent epimerase/dehydratase family protein [Rhodobacterales bacterium HKCCE2091]
MPAINGNRFVVVGGASLLGSNIGRRLLDAGAGEVILMDNLALGSASAVEDLVTDERCTFLRGDMLRMNELHDPFEGASGVFNVAGFLGGPMLANPWMGLDVNVRGIQNVLEVARVRGVGKVVFSSSIGVYGRIGDDPCTENAPFDWNGLGPALALYSGSKIVGEGLCQLYHRQHGLAYAALRYSNLYGENQHKRAIDATRIVNAWERIRAGQSPVIEGDGTNVTDFVYIGDVARANLMAMEADASGAYNIASGRDTSFNELVAALLKACGSELTPEYRADDAKVANPVVTRLGISVEKAKAELGWSPQVDIEEGMRRLVAWLDAERAKGRA